MVNGEPLLQLISNLEMELSVTLKVASYNVLAQGFASPFANTPGGDLEWAQRRRTILKTLRELDADVLCLQEVQSSSRGWGRALTGKDTEGPDHALQLRVQLGKEGYGGAYQVVDDDARSSDSEPKVDSSGGTSAKRNPGWPCEGTPGARIGVATFWRSATWTCHSQKPVLFSTLIMDRTKERGEKLAWHMLKSMHAAMLTLLKHTATGALVLVANVHLPTPGGDDNAVPNPAAPLSKGIVQQVQLSEALVTEAEAFLADIGLEQRVPIVIAGDFNATPVGYPGNLAGSAVYRLFTQGTLGNDPCLSGLAAAKRSREAEPGATPAPAAAPVALPFPAPSCGMGGKFESAYAVVNGAEPIWTNFRRCYDSKLLAAHREAAIAAAIAAAAPAPEDATVDADAVDVAATKAKTAAEAVVKAAGLQNVPGQSEFCATLDYIFFRNPSGAPRAGPPRVTLRAVRTESTPSREAAAALCGSLPSAAHPSDHVPIAAVFEVLST